MKRRKILFYQIIALLLCNFLLIETPISVHPRLSLHSLLAPSSSLSDGSRATTEHSQPTANLTLSTPEELIQESIRCARSKRLEAHPDIRKDRYVYRYDEAVSLLIRALELGGYNRRHIDYFIGKLNDLMEIIIEDPEAAWEALERDPQIKLAKSNSAVRHLFEMKRKEAVLKRVETNKFNQDLYIETMVVPDGEGDYFIDTVGTKGQWEINLTAEGAKDIDSASGVRALDALCDIIFNKRREGDFGELQLNLSKENLSFGQIYLVDGVERAVAYIQKGAFLYKSPGAPFVLLEVSRQNKVRLFFALDFLKLSRKAQRRYLRSAFATLRRYEKDESGEEVISIREEDRSVSSIQREAPKEERPPKVIICNLSQTLGPYILNHSLEMKGITTQIVNTVEEVSWPSPNVFCISLTNDAIEKVNNTIGEIRKGHPDAFIIIGGPAAMRPKSLLALVPDIDILIRGEGEEVLPKAVKILAKTKRSDRLSDEQINEFKAIDGLFLRTPRLIVLNNLDKTNVVWDFDVPIVYSSSRRSYWNITRGCPFKCNFCFMAMGRRYRHTSLGKLKRHIIDTLALRTPLPTEVLNAMFDRLGIEFGELHWEDYEELLPKRMLEFDKQTAKELLSLFNEKLSLFTEDMLHEGAEIFSLDTKKVDSLDSLMNLLPNILSRGQMQYLILIAKRRWIEGILDRGEDLHQFGLGLPPLLYIQHVFKHGRRAERQALMNWMYLPFPEEVSKAVQEVLKLDDRLMQDFLKWNHDWNEEFNEPISRLKIRREEFITLLKTINEHFVTIDAPQLKEIFLILSLNPELAPTTFAQLEPLLPDMVDGSEVVYTILMLKDDAIKGIVLSESFKYGPLFKPVKLEKFTSEDNTLVNKKFISDFCRWVIENRLDRYFGFSAGQNSVNTLLKAGDVDLDFINLLKDAGFNSPTLGTDGLTNNILRQNDKGPYTLSEAIAVNKALEENGFDVSNNHIYSTPYASFLDVVESILLSAVIPFKLRDGESGRIYHILSVLGSQFTNECIVNNPERFIWRERVNIETIGSYYRIPVNALSRGSLFMEYTYVPKEFPEYLFFGDELLLPAESSTQQILNEFKEINTDKVLEFLEQNYADSVYRTVTMWQAPSQRDPELRALGELVRHYAHNSTLFAALGEIRLNIHQKGIHSFSDFLEQLNLSSGKSDQIFSTQL